MAFESHLGCTATWLRLGELEAQKIDCAEYDKNSFKRAVLEIRGMTTKDPEEFVPEMKDLCARSGVALALVPEIRHVAWYGASWWATPPAYQLLSAPLRPGAVLMGPGISR